MRRYADLRERLVANTAEPENAQQCWRWTGRLDRWGYAQVNVYVPGLASNVTMKAHIALFLWSTAECETVNDLYLAYLEHSCSGLELDHLCGEEWCIHPDHLEVVTPSENCRRREQARVSPKR